MSAADSSGRQLEVGILGATGMVGQQFVRLLEGHPWFKTAWLGASERSEGRSYREAMKWRLSTPPPESVLGMGVDACTPGRAPKLLFSALDAGAAKDIEPAFAAAGHVVVSNARSFRMFADVPLVIPEVNPDHLSLIARQRRERGWTGAIVTNPNCSTVVLTVVLAALRKFGISRVMVTTLQAVSGAGYPGVASLDILCGASIEGREEDLWRATWRAGVDTHGQDALGRRRGQPPFHRFAVAAAFRALAGAEPCRLEPRMPLEQPHELLSDHACRAEDTDLELSAATVRCTHDCSSNKGKIRPEK